MFDWASETNPKLPAPPPDHVSGLRQSAVTQRQASGPPRARSRCGVLPTRPRTCHRTGRACAAGRARAQRPRPPSRRRLRCPTAPGARGPARRLGLRGHTVSTRTRARPLWAVPRVLPRRPHEGPTVPRRQRTHGRRPSAQPHSAAPEPGTSASARRIRSNLHAGRSRAGERFRVTWVQGAGLEAQHRSPRPLQLARLRPGC